MIKRYYFMAVEKNHDDGKGSYSYDSIVMDYRSWFADPYKIYKHASDTLKKKMEDIQGGNLQIVSFNKI